MTIRTSRRCGGCAPSASSTTNGAHDLLRQRMARIRRHSGRLLAAAVVSRSDGQAQVRRADAETHREQLSRHRVLGTDLLGDGAELRSDLHADLFYAAGLLRRRHLASSPRQRLLLHPGKRNLPARPQRLPRRLRLAPPTAHSAAKSKASAISCSRRSGTSVGRSPP